MFHHLLLAAALAPQSDAEETPEPDWFSATLTNAGDIDGDGCDDLLIGEPKYLASHLDHDGTIVWIVSGKTGRELTRFRVEQKSIRCLGHVPVGDVDEDGTPDVVLTLRTNDTDQGTHRLQLRSGSSGAVLKDREYAGIEYMQGGGRLVPAPNADSEHTFVLTWRRPFKERGRETSYWTVSLFSAIDLNETSILAREPYDRVILDPLPTRDGVAEADPTVVLGFTGGKSWGGKQLVEYGRMPRNKTRRTAMRGLRLVAPTISEAGDLDGDGRNEVFVVDQLPGDIGKRKIRVSVVSTARNEILAEQSFQRLGTSPTPIQAAIGDVNGDGLPDVLVSVGVWAWPEFDRGPIALPVFSGKDLEQLYLVAQDADPASQPYFGHTACALGDVTGDDVPDIAIGAYDPWGNWSAGRVEIRSGADGSFVRAITRSSL